MDYISNLLVTALQQAGLSLLHNWPYLLVGIFISVLLKLYVDADKVSAFLKRFRGLGIVAATGAAVGTPLCSCGTIAVVLGMMASTMSWAPIVAFMVSSPLTSPEGLFYSAGLFGWPFTIAFFVASILLGLAGGAAAAILESRGWLANQTRFNDPQPVSLASSCECSAQLQEVPPLPLIQLESLPAVNACACAAPAISLPAASCQCSLSPQTNEATSLISLNILQPENTCACASPMGEAALLNPSPLRVMWNSLTVSKAKAGVANFLREFYAAGKQFLPMFLGFAFIGYLLNGLIPASWVAAIFGNGKAYSVPLAATLGLPFYINAEGSLPLIRALLDHGMSQGAALAFLIAGSGTSLGAIAGALTIARWRVVGLVIGVLWAGAVFSGYVFDLLVAYNLF